MNKCRVMNLCILRKPKLPALVLLCGTSNCGANEECQGLIKQPGREEKILSWNLKQFLKFLPTVISLTKQMLDILNRSQ
jgi:hypothetical protein